MKKKGIKVLLIYPNPMMDNLIPIGISLLSSYLKKTGNKVKLFDTTFYNTGKRGDDYREKNLEIIPTDLAKFGINKLERDIYNDFGKFVDEYKPDLMGMSVIEPTYPEGLSLLKHINKKNIPTIVGGAYATIAAKQILKEDCINMVCIGEGEETIVDLANRIEEGKDYSDVKNIWIKKNGRIIKNSLRPLKNLNDLLFQDWEIYDKKRLYKPYLGQIAITAAIETARGCYGGCTFCGNPVLKEKYKGQRYVRFKEPEKVIAEIKFLKEYGIKFINIVDPDFFAKSTEEFEKLANLYKTIKMPFWAEGRVNTVNERKVKLLEEMGCKGFALGVESGNEYIRNKILKKGGGTNNQIINAFSLFKNTRIQITANNIIGLPYESRKEIFDTIELNKKLFKLNSNFRSSVTIFVPYEGTELKKVCIKENYISKDDFAGDYRGEISLNMPQISKKELFGLHRTFLLYIRFPKDMWPQIKIAEQDDGMFTKLSEIYTKKYFK